MHSNNFGGDGAGSAAVEALGGAIFHAVVDAEERAVLERVACPRCRHVGGFVRNIRGGLGMSYGCRICSSGPGDGLLYSLAEVLRRAGFVGLRLPDYYETTTPFADCPHAAEHVRAPWGVLCRGAALGAHEVPRLLSRYGTARVGAVPALVRRLAEWQHSYELRFPGPNVADLYQRHRLNSLR